VRIAITGGKGGTGKSTVATALARGLAKKYNILLLDADADCPNDHIILNAGRKKVKDVFQFKPIFDFDKCIKCGLCAKVCKEKAIVFVKGKHPMFIEDQCIGCKACMIVCPTKAISDGEKKIGTIYEGENYGVKLVTGEMEIGIEEASPTINALKKYVEKDKNKYDFVIVDTAAGTHCSVISALMGCDLALAVTEPTPLGRHDAELILRLTKILDIPTKIILNKADIGDYGLIKDLAKKYETEIIAKIPYRREIAEAYSRGEPIEDEEINKIAKWLITWGK